VQRSHGLAPRRARTVVRSQFSDERRQSILESRGYRDVWFAESRMNERVNIYSDEFAPLICTPTLQRTADCGPKSYDQIAIGP
jgi:hypothetical protein